MAVRPKATMTFGERLLLLRRRADVSQAELGAQVGLTKWDISRLEKGQREAKEKAIRKLAEALGTTPDYLLGFSESPSSRSIAA